MQICLWLLWKGQSTISALFRRRILGQYPAAPCSPGPFNYCWRNVTKRHKTSQNIIKCHATLYDNFWQMLSCSLPPIPFWVWYSFPQHVRFRCDILIEEDIYATTWKQGKMLRYPSAILLGSVFGRTDFSRFIFWAVCFFRGFCRRIFSTPHFWGESAQKNPPGKCPAK